MVNQNGHPAEAETLLRQINVSVEFVTPERASAWLKNRDPSNRDMKRKVVEYGLDIGRGTWIPSHQGPAFDGANRLVDGEHRLRAIAATGTGLWLMVFRNVPSLARSVIDTGVSRSLAHAAQMGGDDWLTNRCAGVINRMMLGLHYEASWISTRQQRIEFGRRYRVPIQFSVDRLDTGHARGVGGAPVKAVVARAFVNGVSAETLSDFCECLRTGVVDSEGKSSAGVLARYLVHDPRARGGGAQAAVMNYAKTERALAAFMEAQSLVKLYATTEELFPLPEDEGIL